MLDDTRLPHKIFEVEYVKKFRWCSNMESLFSQVNKQHMFCNKLKVRNLNEIKDELMEIQQHQFLSEINIKPKLRTYKIFKNTYQPEPYVMRYLSRSSRSIFSQLRTGILPLRIETGRYNDITI